MRALVGAYAIVTLLIASNFLKAQDVKLFRNPNSDDAVLQSLASKADLIVIGKVTSEPFGVVSRKGYASYPVSFKIGESLKGKQKAGETIDVEIECFTIGGDLPPELKKGGECILFLNRQADTWVNADLFLGIQRPSPSMVHYLKMPRMKVEAK